MTFAKRLLSSCAAILLVTTAWADDHAVPKALPMALWSTCEIPAGAKPSELEASLKEYLKDEEKRGFNNCAMCKHEFGSPRVLCTTCTFDDILVKVME